MTFFVKHPPIDGLPPADDRDRDLFTALGETPKQELAIRGIEACRRRFEESLNPIEAIAAFNHATLAGLYPPLWVINFLNERFQRAIRSGSLDRELEFHLVGLGKGRGRSLPAQRRLTDMRNYVWCTNVFRLEAAGLTRSAAAKFVAALWQKHLGEDISEAAVRKAVEENESRYEYERELIIAASAKWTEDEKRELLRHVDPANLPRGIRKLYAL